NVKRVDLREPPLEHRLRRRLGVRWRAAAVRDQRPNLIAIAGVHYIPRVGQGQAGRRDRELAGARDAPGLLGLHIIARLELRHLRGDLDRRVAWVAEGDRPDAAASLD